MLPLFSLDEARPADKLTLLCSCLYQLICHTKQPIIVFKCAIVYQLHENIWQLISRSLGLSGHYLVNNRSKDTGQITIVNAGIINHRDHHWKKIQHTNMLDDSRGVVAIHNDLSVLICNRQHHPLRSKSPTSVGTRIANQA